MAKQRAIPRVSDEQTDRAIKAVNEFVSELANEVQDLPATPYAEAQVVPLRELRPADNVAIDGRATNNLRLVLTQNVTIANPTGVLPGQIINISLIQDGTGSRTASWGSAWQMPGGAKTLSTAADAKDLYSGRVETVSNGTATLILGSLALAHS